MYSRQSANVRVCFGFCSYRPIELCITNIIDLNKLVALLAQSKQPYSRYSSCRGCLYHSQDIEPVAQCDSFSSYSENSAHEAMLESVSVHQHGISCEVDHVHNVTISFGTAMDRTESGRAAT